jgi:hypothetical protein
LVRASIDNASSWSVVCGIFAEEKDGEAAPDAKGAADAMSEDGAETAPGDTPAPPTAGDVAKFEGLDGTPGFTSVCEPDKSKTENAAGLTGVGIDGALEGAAIGFGTTPGTPVGVAPAPDSDGPATAGASGAGNDGKGSPGRVAKNAFAIFVRRSGSGSPGGGSPPPP